MGTRRRREEREPPPPNIPQAALILYNLILQQPFEGLMTYDGILEETGINIRDPRNRKFWYAARDAAQSLHRIVLDCIRNVGYIRLTDAGIVLTGARAVRRITRAAAAGVGRLECANYENLSPNMRTTHDSYRTMLLLARSVVNSHSHDTIRDRCQGANRPLDPTEAMLTILGNNPQ